MARRMNSAIGLSVEGGASAHFERTNFYIEAGNGGGAAERDFVVLGNPDRPSRFIYRKGRCKSKFRNAVEQRSKRQWEGHVAVTEGFDSHNLNEPSREVAPTMKNLKKFFMGDFASKKAQYQKENVFLLEDGAKTIIGQFTYDELNQTILEGGEKRIAIIGQAGSGKTTIMKRLVRDMSKLPQRPRLILFLNFRDIPYTNKTTPFQLLFGSLVSANSLCIGYKWLLKHQKDAIFFFDGLDQAGWSVYEAESMRPYDESSTPVIMSNLFNRNLFPDVKVVYSSREHAVASLKRSLRPKMVIALSGLSGADIKWLFISLIGENGNELWKKLTTESHSLVPLCSIPAFLLFTGIVYKSNPDNPPNYVTGVMDQLLQLFMQSGHITEEDIPKVLKRLKLMAFNGMNERRVLFTVEDVKKVKLEMKEVRDWVIKVPGLNCQNQFLLEGQYVLFYSHQIIQECLSAFHISEMSMDSFAQFVREKLSDNHWSVVKRFLCGILLNKAGKISANEVSDLDEKRILLQEMLTSQYTAMQNAADKLELFAAIFESNDGVFIQSLVHEIVFENQLIGASGIYVLSSVMCHCTWLNELRLDNCSIDADSAKILWENIKESSMKLQKLSMTQNPGLGVKGFVLVWQVAAHCEVREFIVSDNRVLENHLKAIQEIKLPKLKTLDLSKNYNLSAEALGVVGTVIPDGIALILKFCNLGDSALQRFKTAVGSKKVTKVDISSNTNIGGGGFADIGEIAKQCAVDEMIMRNCSLTDSSAEIFASQAEGAKLSLLDLTGNMLTTALVIDQIKQSLISCTVLFKENELLQHMSLDSSDIAD